MKKRLTSIIATFLLIAAVCFFNAVRINPGQLKIREETIIDSRFSDRLDGLCIAFFSDLQYGGPSDEDRLAKLVRTINAFSPDLIIFGGDLFSQDQTIDQESKDLMIGLLKSLDARYGKYAVMGDQDLEKQEDVQTILVEGGFIDLSDSSVSIIARKNEAINLVGLSPVSGDSQQISSLFQGIDPQHYTFVITHYPDRFTDIADQRFDYCLAGHSLGGQVYLPVISLFGRPEGCQKYLRGKTTRDSRTLDISNGIGMKKHEARFLADSEVVFYRLDLPDSAE